MTETTVDTGALAEVERRFTAQIDIERLHPGASLAVYAGGRLVLDLAAGLADAQTAEPVRADTLFVLFSACKPLAAVAVLQQVERGRASLDDPVAAHWPGFAHHGKDRVTIRHILTHRGGFPDTPPELTPDRWGDWDAVVRAMEEITPRFPPGEVSAYHGLNFGWVCAELVRRLDGRDFSRYLRDEIAGPLGLHDTHVGLPPELEPRVAKLHLIDRNSAAGADAVRLFNRPDIHRAIQPAGNGISTARDMARFYAVLAAGGSLGGARLLAPETVAMALRPEVDGESDPVLRFPTRRGLLGLLDGPGSLGTPAFGTGSTRRTFGHGGHGTSVCWGDADLGLGFAFIPNGLHASGGPVTTRRWRELSDTARRMASPASKASVS